MSAITAKYLKDINDTLKRMVEPTTPSGGTGLDVIFDETISGTPRTWTKNTDLVGDGFVLSEWEMFVNVPSHIGWEFLEITSPGMNGYDAVAEADMHDTLFIPNYVSGEPEEADPGATVRISGNGATKYATAEYIRRESEDDGAYSVAKAERAYGLPDGYMTSVAINSNHVLGWADGDVTGIPEGTRVLLRGVRTDAAPEVYYTISNTLSNVLTSNQTTTIKRGGNYSAALTAEDGFRLETVTVVMGATDITSTAYSAESGVVTINAVSGDIVIAATATPIKQLNIANLADFFTVSLSHYASEPTGELSLGDYFTESGQISLTEDESDASSWQGSWSGALAPNANGTATQTSLSLTCKTPCYLSVDLSSTSSKTIMIIDQSQQDSYGAYVAAGDTITFGFLPRDSCTASISVTIEDDSLAASDPNDFSVSDAEGGGIKLVPGNFGCHSSYSEVVLTAKQDLSGVAVSALYKTEKNADEILITKVSGGISASLGNFSGDSGVEASIWSGDLSKSDAIEIKYTKDASVDASGEEQTYIRVRANE